jgi:anti-anti-sigma regulatory factor
MVTGVGQSRQLLERAENAAARFRVIFEERAALSMDRHLAGPLSCEVRPVAEAILHGVQAAARVHADAPELRESLAFASLLGRRAAVLGATPTAALAIAGVLVEALTELGETRASALGDALRDVCVEGFAAEREERANGAAARRAAAAIPIVEIASGCIAVFVAGDQDAEEIERVVDEVGKKLLERNARACVVDVAALTGNDRDRVRAIFGIHAACAMLGVRCIFTGVSERARAHAIESGIDLETISIERDVASGLRAALEICGLELRAKAALGDVLRRLVRPRER